MPAKRCAREIVLCMETKDLALNLDNHSALKLFSVC